MGKGQKVLPSKLFAGLFTERSEILDEVIEALTTKYGDVDIDRRRFLSFDRLIDPSRLARIKRATLRMEQELTGVIRIEPGYITSANVVRASAKAAAWRIYLGQGVFGEVALMLRDGGLDPIPWTGEDYRDPEALDFFLAARKRYLEQMKIAVP
jgi:hypothetical protein